MTKHAYFWAKMAIFGPKILIFSGRGKTSGTHLSTSFALFYWLGIASKWPQRPIFARFWAKNPLWGGRSKIYPHIGEPIRHLFCVKNSKRQGFQKTTPKKFHIRGTDRLLGLIPNFGHFLGVARQKDNYP